MADNPILDAALALASRGLRVFPCKARAKTPATAHGCKDASSDPDVIQKWFSSGERNLAIATGPGSGLWVLDLDGDEGIAAFTLISKDHDEEVPLTPTVRTGGGGKQLYFLFNGREVKNRAKIGGDPIDCRGTGGYVVAPPSVHPSGKAYEWIVDLETPIAEAPDWLVDLVVESAPSAPSPGGCEFTFGAGDDLESKPREDRGRHDQLLSMMGAAIAAGEDPAEVREKALRWAGECGLEAKEVDRLLGYVLRQRKKAIDADLDAVDAATIPEPEPWPELGAEALQGIAGEIVSAIEPETESDPVAILIQLLVGFGNLLGRGPHFVIEGTSHHANLYAVLVGSTARGRKGTSEGRVRSILETVDPQWSGERIANGLVSGEGLVWAVRDPIVKHDQIKDKGKVVGFGETIVDPGVEDKRLLVIESEFGSVLRVCRREQNTLSTTIRSAWDSGRLRTLAKNSPAIATGAHVSIVGHITGEELLRLLSEVEGFSGFANRFLWFAVRRSKLLPDGGEDLDLERYTARLKAIAEQSRLIERMTRDQGASRLWREVYRDLAEDSQGGLLGAVTSRAEAQTLRLSMIYALLDRSETIREEHLRAGLAVWRYAEASAKRIFGKRTADPLLERLLDLIREEPGISRRELRRKVSSSVPLEWFIKTLALLRSKGLVHSKRRETGGRPSEEWYSGREDSFDVAKSCQKGTEEDLLSPFDNVEKRVRSFGYDPDRDLGQDTKIWR